MKNMFKKGFFITALITLMTVLFCFGASALAETGQCGDNVTYTYNSTTKELVISGTGAMKGYPFGGSPFYHSDIKSVVIKSGVTTIGSYAFAYCDRLTSVTIPDSVTTIGDSAFRDCDRLTSVTIPDSVTTIGDSAFACCNRLTSITVDKNNKYYCNDSYGVLYNKNKTELIQYPIGNTRTEYTIPDSVTTIGDDAFAYCDRLTSVTIGNSVTTIGDDAFNFCERLTSVTIPDSVTTIDYNAFYHCVSLNDVYYCGTQEQWKKINIDFYNSSLTSATIHYNYKPGSHSFKTTITKATFSANGKTVCKCSCGYTVKTTTIYSPKTFTLSATKYIHDGKNKTPTVTIKDSKGNKLVKNTDYKTSVASKRSGIGRYTVKVTFIGKYEGTKNLYFTILPGATTSLKASGQTIKSLKLTWSAVSGAIGYKVYRYSPAKKDYVSAGTTTNTSITVSKLLEGTRYEFKVLAYGKTSAGKVYNSETYTSINTATRTEVPELIKVTASSVKGKVYVYHSDENGESGYQVYYSTSKTSGFKKYRDYSADTDSSTVNGLTSGKTYYFKVRTYIKTDSGYVYSPWSAVKSIKVK